MNSTAIAIQASKIQPTANRCFNCKRFRYCQHESSSGLICDDCVTLFRNQKIINIAAPPKPTTQPKPQPKKRPVPRKPKSVVVREISRSTPIKEATAAVLKVLKKHPCGLRFPEIVDQLNAEKYIIHRAIEVLIKHSEINFDENRQKNRLYFHPIHRENIAKFAPLKITRANDTELIKEAINNFPNICIARDLMQPTSKSRNCVLRNLRLLAARGEVLSYTEHDTNTTYFASKTNPQAAQKFQEFINNSEPVKIMNFLADGRAKSRFSIAKMLGKKSYKGVIKILGILEEEGKIRSFKVREVNYYKKL